MSGPGFPLLTPRLHVTVSAVVVLLVAVNLHACAQEYARSSLGGVGELLSAPMPGTRAREDADLTARLEQALSSFDGVEAASVIISFGSDDRSPSPEVAIQMRLSGGFTPTPTWLEAIRAFSLRTIPELDESALTIIDSSGRLLYDGGETHLTPGLAPPPEAPLLDATFAVEPWWLWIAAGAGFVLVLAGVMTHRAVNKTPEPAAEATDPGPFGFLDSVPDEQIATVLAQERPEVIAAVLALLPASTRGRLSEWEPAFSDLPAHLDQPDPAMTAALVKALRAKLVSA
ncbi:MAG: hypothetical protein ACOCX2_06710 [Armatimonadota bacterium]